MTYEELTAKRHQLQIQIAGIDKQLILIGGDPARQILSFLNEKTGKKYSDDDMTTAKLIYSGVKRLNSKSKEPNLKTWASDIRKMRQLDDRGTDEIRSVFAWANDDSFWQANILSPAKLRKQYDQLVIKMRSNGNGNRQTEAERCLQEQAREAFK